MVIYVPTAVNGGMRSLLELLIVSSRAMALHGFLLSLAEQGTMGMSGEI